MTPRNPPHLEFEAGFWGDCSNTYNEERKQHVYAQHMGLTPDPKWPFGYLAGGLKVLDIGGGPTSLLLKTTGFKQALVQDPTSYPAFVYGRYTEHNISWSRTPGEHLLTDIQASTWVIAETFDEVWLYNVLQHTEDPHRILSNVTQYLAKGGIFRFFEWINIPAHEGHPHMITPDMFEPIYQQSKGMRAITSHIDRDGCFGEFLAGWVQL
jgi:SAM-dependent methyltransferase